MAFPTVESITETTTSSATVHNIDMPATVNAGDLLLMLVTGIDSNINSDPPGWTVLRASVQTPVYIKDAVGTEDGGTVAIGTSSSSSIAAQVYRITGWFDTGTILNDIELATTTGSSTTPDPPTLNPANWDAEDTLWIAVAIASLPLTGYPSGYTGGVVTPTTGFWNIGSAQRDNNVASENPGAFTMSGGSTGWRTHTIAVRPDPGAVLFEGSETVSFDGTADMDVVADIVFTGSGSLDFDGVAQVTQNAVFEGSEEVSFDGTAVLSGGAVLLIGDGAISFDGTAVLNQDAVFDGISEVSMNGLAQLGVIREFAATRAVSFDGEATLGVVGWIDVDEPFGPTWNNAT